jgi:hypothetical protein
LANEVAAAMAGSAISGSAMSTGTRIDLYISLSSLLREPS